MIFKKYEFPDEATAKTRIAALPTDEEGNPIHKHSIKELGYLWIAEPTYDEEGNEVSVGTKANVSSVDVLWKDQEEDWSDVEIQYDESWVSPNGAHRFLGWSFTSDLSEDNP